MWFTDVLLFARSLLELEKKSNKMYLSGKKATEKKNNNNNNNFTKEKKKDPRTQPHSSFEISYRSNCTISIAQAHIAQVCVAAFMC